MKTRTILICFFWAVVASTGVCNAWGPGHEEVAAHEVFSHLPQSIQDKISPQMLQKAIMTYSHYPDSFAAFQADEIGAPAVKKLTENGIKNRYGIHSDKGRALAFVLLVDAFLEKNYDHAAIWIAALSHSTSDMAAINHDPLVHGLIYTSAYKLRLTDGKPLSATNCFDLQSLAKDKEGAEIWKKSIAPMLIADDGRDAKTAIIEILGYGQEGALYCGSRGIPILTDAVTGMEKMDREARQRSMTNLADLGAWAVGRTVRDVCVAARLAQANTSVELTPEILAKFDESNAQFMKERKLDDDALFIPLLRPIPKQGTATVGIILEPTWRMNDAMLGYGDRVWSASICRSMLNAKRDYATVDIRASLTNGFPSPTQVPVLIISATALRDYGWMHVADLNRQLQSYMEAGGRVLWIGGDAKPSKPLATIANAMTRTDKQPLPVPDDQILKMHLSLLGDNSGETQWNFLRSPSLKVGWSQPFCPWSFAKPDAADFDPLLELSGDNEKLIVGVIWKDRDSNRPKAAYLPVYAIAPHLLTQSELLMSPGEPVLDSPGERIIFSVVDRLLPRQ